jgi:hypothetical protein
VIAPGLAPDLVAGRLVAELAEWRDEHPGWTPAMHLAAFPPEAMWCRVDVASLVGEFDWDLYERLCGLAGHPPEGIA